MSLLGRDRCDRRPKGQFILVRVRPSCFHLVKMWWRQVSLLSRWRPRYLTWSALGSCTSFMCTGGHLPERVVKVMCTDLSGLVCIRQVRSQV
jgi:hypothetical protein